MNVAAASVPDWRNNVPLLVNVPKLAVPARTASVKVPWLTNDVLHRPAAASVKVAPARFSKEEPFAASR